MLRVRDIMTRRVVSLAADTPVESAIWRFASEDVSGAPVRDARGHLVGVVSKSDLVELVQRAGESKGVVEDVMTPGVWAVRPDAPALDAVKLMLEQHIHRVLVMGGPDRLEGIVTAMDVMRALVRGMDFSPTQSSFKRPDKGDADDDSLEDDVDVDTVAVSASAESRP